MVEIPFQGMEFVVFVSYGGQKEPAKSKHYKPPRYKQALSSIPEGNLHGPASKKYNYCIADNQKSRTFAASLVKSIIGLLNALTH